MTHQSHPPAMPREESKETTHPSSSSVTTSAFQADEPPQASVYFDPKEWSRRYTSTFFTASVASYSLANSTVSYHLLVRCADDSWEVQQPFPAFERLLQELRPAAVPAGAPPLPTLPPKAWTASQEGFAKERQPALQSFLNALLQRRDICRLRPIRAFLALDTPLTAQQEPEDSEEGKEEEGDVHKGEDAV